MKQVVIFGNSGSGKSTLARSYAESAEVKHLDLDEIAWKAPGIRKELEESIGELKTFISKNSEWIIEGCYGSLIAEAARRANELLFLNPGIEACQKNCRARPWERHKYETKEQQDQNLEMLLNWVAGYQSRTDEFSLAAHREIFDSFSGPKQELRSNAETQSIARKLSVNKPSSSQYH